MSRKRDYLLLPLSILFLCAATPAFAEPVEKADKAELDRLYEKGKCLIEGCKNSKKDPEKGKKLLEKASGQSHAAAQFYLGSIEYNDDNKPRAIMLYRAAANNGNADGQTAMGLYHVDKGMKLVHQLKEQQAHYQEAVRWFKMAVDQGHSEAKFWYGDMLTKGIGVEPNLNLGRKYLLQSAEAGNMNGLAMVSYYLATGEMGFKKNPELAYKYGYKSLKKGNANASNVLSFSEKQLTKEQQAAIRKKVDATLASESKSGQP